MRLTKMFLSRHEKNFMDPRKISLRFMKIKGKIVLDTKNTQIFRLRRAKNTVCVSISVQIVPFSVHIAPEGREIFLDVKFFASREK